MKKTLCVLLLAATTSAMATTGLTYCPKPGDFKLDKGSGQMQAPGGWAVPNLGAPVTINTFVRVEADDNTGQISGCVYNMTVQGQQFQLPATDALHEFTADNLSSWTQGNYMKYCQKADPEACTFHQKA